jgi:hypothetical protein
MKRESSAIMRARTAMAIIPALGIVELGVLLFPLSELAVLPLPAAVFDPETDPVPELFVVLPPLAPLATDVVAAPAFPDVLEAVPVA